MRFRRDQRDRWTWRATLTHQGPDGSISELAETGTMRADRRSTPTELVAEVVRCVCAEFNVPADSITGRSVTMQQVKGARGC